jgi:small subunit ribosomal protein S21
VLQKVRDWRIGGLKKAPVSLYSPILPSGNAPRNHVISGLFSGENKAGRHMIKVKSRGNETAEQMLRRFKKLCEKEGLIKDMKRVSYYEKPSEKRRRRMRKSQTRQLKTGFEM